ncbi:MAG: hypothetical protein HWE27_08660 [Gammaproteobacteria bacterium]|nr:hypothetical protein [Gammaproteobacteria bacterium]
MQHQVRYFFPFNFSLSKKQELENYYERLQSLSLQSLTQSIGREDLVSKPLPTNPIWTREKFNVDPRFNDHVGQILNGRDKNQETAFFGFNALKISADARHIINGGSPGSPGKGLRCELSNAAKVRLAKKSIAAPYESEQWPVSIQDAWILHINTGVGILLLDINYSEPDKSKKNQVETFEAIAELNYRLHRNRDNKQLATLVWPESNCSVKGLRQIAHALLPWLDEGLISKFGNWQSIFTYTSIQCDESMDDEQIKQQCFRIARHYTDAYLPNSVRVENDYYQPFDNICHYHSLEGVASIIAAPPEQSTALDNFLTTAIARAYQPITAIAYSEYLFLQQMSQGANLSVDMRDPSDQDFEQLRKYRTKLYNFRLNNRFSHLSGITQHNEFYNHLKDRLGIAALLNDISTDVAEIESFIADHIAEKNQRSLGNIKLMGSMFAALVLLADLSGISIMDALFDNSIPPTAKIIFWSLVIGIPIIFFGLSRWLKDKLD